MMVYIPLEWHDRGTAAVPPPPPLLLPLSSPPPAPLTSDYTSYPP